MVRSVKSNHSPEQMYKFKCLMMFNIIQQAFVLWMVVQSR